MHSPPPLQGYLFPPRESSKGPLLKVYEKAFTLIWSGGGKYLQMWFHKRSERIKVCKATKSLLHPPQTAHAPPSLCQGCTYRADQLGDRKTFPSCGHTFERNQFPELVTRLPACQCQLPAGGRKVQLPATAQD